MKLFKQLSIVFLVSLLVSPLFAKDGSEKPEITQDIAYFAGGCFWCTEAVFETKDGVINVVSGYQNGTLKNPNYKQVSSGKSGHAESVQITFNPKVVSYESLLRYFFKSHDPTTLNRQGADVGTQYRSGIYYTNDEQKQIAESVIKDLTEKKVFPKPITTEILKAETFYSAEDYHQDYYRNNPYSGYSRYITSKLKKLEAKETK